MDIVDWIRDRCPGAIDELRDRIEISHATGERSTIWFGEDSVPNLLVGGGFYSRYDGMDLLSSTFKVASSRRRERAGVPLVFDFAELLAEVRDLDVEFPAGSRPFMYQSGIGYYAVNNDGRIHEWDSEIRVVTATYGSIIEVLEEWFAAVYSHRQGPTSIVQPRSED
jgi:hypothetical protein